MAAHAAEAKAGNHKTKAPITPLVGGKGEPQALTRKRMRDKTAGIGTTVQDIVMAVNLRINKGFNFDENWIILESGAQTTLFYNAKLLKGLCQKVNKTQIVGISDQPIEITHEG